MNFEYRDSSDFTILPICHESDNIITVHKNHEYTSLFHPLQKIVESEESKNRYIPGGGLPYETDGDARRLA